MTSDPEIRAAGRGVQAGERPGDCVLVLFGASGDLATRELVPSLFELHAKDLLPERLAVIGVARRDWSDGEYRERMRRSVEKRCSVGCEGWDGFGPSLHFHTVDVSEPDDFRSLARRIEELRSEAGIPDRVLFHLALPPFLFADTVTGLKEAGLSSPDDPGDDGWRRLVVEKPFGRDLESARALDRSLKSCFPERDIYRIDHFLGKETVQNMLVFRFGNPGFEPIWNRDHIDHVQITVAESKGVAGRAGFYESTGVVRDMVQNHLLQLLCMVAVEPPVTFDARSLRDETVKVLRSARVAGTDDGPDLVVGQYRAGEVAGDAVHGYRAEDGVDPDSRTPTYAALKLELDSWRWAGVPFYLRTGKRLPRKLTEVVIHFRPTPHRMFRQEARPNLLAFRLQPDEGIIRTFVAKRPGPELVMEPVQMRFTYADAFDVKHPPRAYAWLRHDAMRGDPTLFARSDWIEEAWRLTDPVVERSETGDEVIGYPAGSWGPDIVDPLSRDGRRWTEV